MPTSPDPSNSWEHEANVVTHGNLDFKSIIVVDLGAASGSPKATRTTSENGVRRWRSVTAYTGPGVGRPLPGAGPNNGTI